MSAGSLPTDLPVSELRFHFKGGRLCLDLVATVGERWRRSFERLREPQDLGRWLVEAELLETAPVVAADELDAARALREAINRLARPGVVPRRGDLRELNHRAALPPLAPVLAPDLTTVRVRAERPVEASLSTIARDAIDLLSGPLAGRIRECSSPDCALLFVDASRPGRRRWCSMEGCGNRAKTARYRGRVRAR